MKALFKNIAVITLALTFTCVHTASAAGLKERMAQRLPQIITLKTQGIVGENNHGYLEFIGSRSNESLINDENSDRKKVYIAISKQQGAPLDVVEKRRAAQIESMGGSGEWFQDKQGEWYKK